MPKLTPEACRAGRALLDWGVRDLASESGVNYVTIARIEAGTPPRASTEEKILAAFAAHGVEITNGEGTGARLVHATRSTPKRKK